MLVQPSIGAFGGNANFLISACKLCYIEICWAKTKCVNILEYSNVFRAFLALHVPDMKLKNFGPQLYMLLTAAN